VVIGHFGEPSTNGHAKIVKEFTTFWPYS